MDQRKAWRRARKILAEHQVEQKLHDPLAPAAVDAHMTLRAFADQYWLLMARRWKPGTARQNRRLLDSHILPVLGRRRMDKLSRADILAWRSGFAHLPAVADRAVPVLSGLFGLAETLRVRPEGSNPARRIRRYRSKPTHETRFLSGEELQRLGEVLAAFDAETPMVCDMIRLLRLTGCRSGEIQSLHWEQVDGSFLHLPDSKSGASTRFLGKPARDILRRYREAAEREGCYAPDAPVFADPASGRPVRITWQLWDRIRNEAGLPDTRLHDLRHSFASHAAMLRVNLPTIQTLLGHKSIENSAIYAHLGEDSVRAASDRVAGLIAGIASLELTGEVA